MACILDSTVIYQSKCNNLNWKYCMRQEIIKVINMAICEHAFFFNEKQIQLRNLVYDDFIR